MNRELQGWEYIKSLMVKCPDCGQTPTLGIPAYPNFGKKKKEKTKWRVCCGNSCCTNRYCTHEYENPFLAINEWNKKYGGIE